jgi:predicted dinucleotide-binding enzyme
MKIAVIGAGDVGGTLGAAWMRAGHLVTFGARDPQSDSVTKALAATGGRAAVASVADALGQAEVVVLAAPGAAVAGLVREHAAALDGKIVVDATNTFDAQGAMRNSVAAIRAAAPAARVVRAFNSLGYENMAQPVIGGVQADLFYCASEAARETAERLIADVGLRPVRVGDLDQVDLVDTLGRLWGALAYGQGMGRRLAFKVLVA